jgi:hypothetical protein
MEQRIKKWEKREALSVVDDAFGGVGFGLTT